MTDAHEDPHRLEGHARSARARTGPSAWAAAQESGDEAKEGAEGRRHDREVGQGGGTGTGAAPVAPEPGRELEALTVVRGYPLFAFQGRRCSDQAEWSAFRVLRERVETPIVIENDPPAPGRRERRRRSPTWFGMA